jgi:hypothetical protein
MKSYLRNGIVVVAALAVSAGAEAATVVQTFTETFSLTATPTGAVPQINTTWNVPQYNGFGGLTSLTGVSYDVSTQIFYRGVLVAVGTGASTAFNLQVRSDFNFNLPTTTADVTTLDPTISLNGTSDAANIRFNMPGTPSANSIASSTANSATRIATDLATYVGSGTVAVPVTGSLLTSALGGYHNNSSDGPLSPYVFVNNAKIFPMFGMQEFSLVATMVVTYTVPEPGTWGAVGALTLLAGAKFISRRRSRGA